MSIPNGSCMPSHCRCAGALPSNARVTRDIGPHNRRKRERENINLRRKPVRGKILDMESSCESSLLYLFVFWIDSQPEHGRSSVQPSLQTGVILRDFSPEGSRVNRAIACPPQRHSTPDASQAQHDALDVRASPQTGHYGTPYYWPITRTKISSNFFTSTSICTLAG